MYILKENSKHTGMKFIIGYNYKTQRLRTMTNLFQKKINKHIKKRQESARSN